MADGDCKKDLGKKDRGKKDSSKMGHAFKVYPQAWGIVMRLHECLSRIVGKYTAYPNVDSSTFQRIHSTLNNGINWKGSAADLGNYCQGLRAVTSCDTKELMRPKDADDTDTRIMAIAQVVRDNARLDNETFRELLTGLLSWTPTDKEVIRDTLVRIIRS